MKYVSEHLARRVFEFEGISNLSYMIEKGDYCVAYDLTSGYYHVSLHINSRLFVGFQLERSFVINIIDFPLVCLQPLGCFQKSFVNL